MTPEYQPTGEPAIPDAPAQWRMVPLREYSEPLDLSDKNLFDLLTRSKEEVSKVVGVMAAKSEMPTEEIPGEYVTSLTGEVADEVHEWPNATVGPGFRHLILQFREERLIHMSWKFQTINVDASLNNKPWWRFW